MIFGIRLPRLPDGLLWKSWLFLLMSGLLFGYVCAVFPASTVLKGIVLMVAGLVVVFGLTVGAVSDYSGSRYAKKAMFGWLFLLGACPAYLPFKFGPLPGLNPLRLALWITIALWVFDLVSSKTTRAHLLEALKYSKLFVTFAVFYVLWQIVCALFSEISVFSLQFVAKGLLPAFVVMLVSLTYCRTMLDVQRAVIFVLGGAFVTCVAGLIEWRLQSNVFTKLLPSDPTQMEAMEWILIDKARSGVYRVSSTFSHPLALAEYLCMCLPLAAAACIFSKKITSRIFFSLLFLLMLLVIYLTQTRSAIVAVGVVLGSFGFLIGWRSAGNRKRLGIALFGWSVLLTLAIGSVALLGVTMSLIEGRNAGEAGSTQARLEMASRAKTLVSEQPIIGYGPGLGALKIGHMANNPNSLTIDSYYLSVVIETGLVGVMLFLGGMFFYFWGMGRAALQMDGVGSWVLPAIMAAVAASLTIKIILSLQNNFDYLYFLIGLGLVIAQVAAKKRGAHE